eukprot:403332835
MKIDIPLESTANLQSLKHEDFDKVDIRKSFRNRNTNAQLDFKQISYGNPAELNKVLLERRVQENWQQERYQKPNWVEQTVLPLRKSLPPIEKKHYDRETEFRQRLDNIKKSYQITRMKGDVANQRYQQSPKYYDPVDDDGYQFKRQNRIPQAQEYIYNRPRVINRVIDPPPIFIDPKAQQNYDPMISPYYYDTPYFQQYFSPAKQPNVKLSPLFKSPQHPIVQVQREVQMKNDIINGLSNEISRVKNYDSFTSRGNNKSSLHSSYRQSRQKWLAENNDNPHVKAIIDESVGPLSKYKKHDPISMDTQIHDLKNYMVSNNPDLDRPFHYYASGNYYNVNFENRVDEFIRLAVDYDEIWDRGQRLLDEIKQTFLSFKDQVNKASNLQSNPTLPVHFMPWASDVKIDMKLKEFDVIKEDLQRFLARLPKHTMMHKLRNEMFKDLQKYRYELERIAQLVLSDHRRPIYPPALINEIKPPNFKAFIHQNKEEVKHMSRYNPLEGVRIHFDYIINVLKNEYSHLQIIYTVFNKGRCFVEPQMTRIFEVQDYHHGPRKYGQAVFNQPSLIIEELYAEPDSFLVLEILGKPCNPKKLFIETQIDGDGNGYPLTPDDELERLMGSMWMTKQGLKPIGWTAMPLFCDHLDLQRGHFKLPIYVTPTHVNRLSSEEDIFHKINRQGTMTAWIRIYHGNEDNQFISHPSLSHLYGFPLIHDFDYKDHEPISKRDPTYKCTGFHVFIHYTRGHAPVKPIRVAFCLQFGKHIIKHSQGGVCFFATAGINPPRKKKKKTANGQTPDTAEEQKSEYPPDCLIFQSGKVWVRDFYNWLWDMWDEDTFHNLNLLVQLIQVKEEVKQPTVSSLISRELIEAEYDLIGYGVVAVNDINGKINYGDYSLKLHEGPIYVEDYTLKPTKVVQLEIYIL